MADIETQESLPSDSSLNDPDDAENRSVPQISKRINILNLDLSNLSTREEWSYFVIEWSFHFELQLIFFLNFDSW